MDTEQRQAAASAVRHAMASAGLEAPQLAALAGVNVETVRDFLAARRWPRAAKRGLIEDALRWPRGRISALADEAARPQGDPVQLALRATDLTPEEQLEVLDVYLAVRERRRPRRAARA